MKNSIRKIAIWGAIISPILFVILTTLAMIFYPGGYYIGSFIIPSQGYRFSLNVLSDLGMVIAINGEPNTISLILWGIALTLVGLTFMFYIITIPSYFPKSSTQRIFAIIGSGFGIISALGFIGVAFTPWDILLDLHVIAVFVAFPVSLGYSIFYALAIFVDKSYPKIWGVVFVVFTLAMASYVLLLFGAGQTLLGTDPYFIRRVNVLSQKAIAYLNLFVILIQATGSYLVLKKRKI
jgi:hypothetical protein